MESDGPKTEAGGEAGRTLGNVVQFPRDWLGPRDELVPIGRIAYPESEERREEQKQGESAPPPGPDAFWGEDSAEIHDAMLGPETGERPGELPTPRRESDKPIARDVAHGSPAPHGLARFGASLRSHTIRLAAGLLVAAACVTLALVRFGAAPDGHVNRARATGRAGPAAGAIADGPASGAITLALLRSNAAHKVAQAKLTGGSTSRRRPHAVVHRRIHAPKQAARHAPRRAARPTTVSVDTAAVSSTPAVTTEPTTASQSAAPSPSSSPSSSSRVTSVAGSSSSAPTTTQPTSTTRSSSHRPASTPRPAFGALGTVAPGSSPDG
jgi:hypothetical protein